MAVSVGVIVLLIIQVKSCFTLNQHLINPPISDEEVNLVSSALENTVTITEPCLLIVAHDYPQEIPEVFENIFKRTDIYTLAIQYRNESLPPFSSFDYWFSWLYRERAKPGCNNVLVAVLCYYTNFQGVMELLASLIQIRTDRDLFFLWMRFDSTEEVLTHSHAQVLRLKFSLTMKKESSELMLQTVCFFCKSGEPEIITLGYFRNAFVPSNMNLFPDLTLNLKGKHMTGMFIYDFTKESIMENRRKFEPIFDADANLFELSLMLNFSFSIIQTATGKNVTADIMLPNGSWTGIIGSILHGESTMSPCTIYSPVTKRVVDFPEPFWYNHMTFLTRAPRPSFGWTSMIRSYTPEMWGLIFLACILSTVVLYIMLVVVSSFSKPFEPRHPPSSNFDYAFRYIFFPLMEENPMPEPTSHTLRVFVSFWWLFALIVVWAYDCKLIGFLVTPTLEVTPPTFIELSTWKDWRWGMERAQAPFYHVMIESSTMKQLHDIEHGMERPESMRECVEMTLQDNFACLTLVDFLKAEAYYFMTSDGVIQVKLSEEDTIRLIFSPILPKNSVITPRVARAQKLLYQSGVRQKLSDDHFYWTFVEGLRIARMLNKQGINNFEPLTYQQLKGPFGLLFATGWVLPVFSFLYEFGNQKICTKKDRI